MENILVNKTKTNLLTDIIIFVVFLVVYEVKATGETIHEWLEIVIGLILIIHIVLHWKWIVITTKQFLTNLKTETKLNYMVDILIFIGFTTIIFTGIMMSKNFLPTFGIRINENHFWRQMHSFSVDLTLFLTAFHFALHWEWIVNNCKRYIISPLKNKKSAKIIHELELVRANEYKSSPFLSIIRISGKFLVILLFSGIISLGWYTVSATIPTRVDSQDNHSQIDQNAGKNVNTNAESRFNQEREHDKHHGAKAFLIFEILKNLLIFCVVTIVVNLVDKKIKKRYLDKEHKFVISSEK